eukprot:TRINITY_DN5178_c0_g4_i1.p1 TRINITY_DN5178_c0_g4~~TRINITY_DN5178_c0_g4_i1.p1  ORF type:complete len:918 (+),score=302.95 TRINITY_DN5178_c0_g4_i1:87-2840(+)
MSALWDQFVSGMRGRNVALESLLHATEAELEEIFTEQGYRAVERAQLRTTWYEKKSRMGNGEIPILAQTCIVGNASREYAEVKGLLDHYVCPEPSMTVSIVELERITNPVLQKRFERRKSELSDGVNGVVVRRFHSPVSHTNAKIQDVGFSLPAEGPQMSLRFLAKAPAVHPPGAYKLLLCDVAVGKYKAVSGDGESITPEQLASEHYDSVYLFYSGAGGGGHGLKPTLVDGLGAAAATPDEFILFHPDQVLPRHCVTFLVHPALAAAGSPLRSPASYSSRDASLNAFLPQAQRELSHHSQEMIAPRGSRGASPAFGAGGGNKYWIMKENVLVNGDSLLVGENKGKKFVSLADGVDTQAEQVKARQEVVDKGVSQLKRAMADLNDAKEREGVARDAAISLVNQQTQVLLQLLEDRRRAAVGALEENATGVIGRLEDNLSELKTALDALEGYAKRIGASLAQSQSNPEDFVLSSNAFLQEMTEWRPSYSVQATVALPPPGDFVYDIDHALRALETLTVAEGAEKKHRRDAPHTREQHAALTREYNKRVVFEDANSQPPRRSPGRGKQPRGAPSPEHEVHRARSRTPQAAKPRGQSQGATSSPFGAHSTHSGAPPPEPHAPPQGPPAPSPAWDDAGSATPMGGMGMGAPQQATPVQHHHHQAPPPPPPHGQAYQQLPGQAAPSPHVEAKAQAVPYTPHDMGPTPGPERERAGRGGAQRAGSRNSTPRKTPRSASRAQKVPQFSIVLIGDAAVGKTGLMEAWLGEDPPRGADLEQYLPTNEPVSFVFTVITSKGKMNVTVTDMPGSQLYPDALGAADAAVIVFDCSSHCSYDNTSKWYSYLPYHIPVALCGNKSNETGRVIRARDITFHREVNAAIKETLVNYYDISVATRYNVDKPWTWICRKLMKDTHLVVKEIISTY